MQSYLLEASAEPLKDSLHVAALLHRDYSCVILLIDPNQECFLIVVPAQRKVIIDYTVLMLVVEDCLSSVFVRAVLKK